MTTNHDKLEALAKAATPGEWQVAGDWSRYAVMQTHSPHKRVVCTGNQNNDGCDKGMQPWSGANRADAEFIAAANPAVVLELLAELKRVELDSDLREAKAQTAGYKLALYDVEMRRQDDQAKAAQPVPEVVQPDDDVPLPFDDEAWSAYHRAHNSELPELPKADGFIASPATISDIFGYSADKMHDYARQHAAQCLAAQPAVLPDAVKDASYGKYDDKKLRDIGAETYRACGELPLNYEIVIELENGCGTVTLVGPDGNRTLYEGSDYFDGNIRNAIDAAILQSAKQGESSND